MTRRRLTPHQREVYDRLVLRAGGTRAWVPLANLGSRTALQHLVAKGWAERQELRGPKGGSLLEYRPTEA